MAVSHSILIEVRYHCNYKDTTYQTGGSVMKKILIGMSLLVSLMLCFSSPAWAGAQEDFNAGVAAANQGHYDQAIRFFTRVIESRASRWESFAYFNRAQCWFKKRNYDQTIADLTMLFRVDAVKTRQIIGRQRTVLAYLFWGFAKFKKGEYDSALGLLENAIQLNTRFAAAFHVRGLVWFDRGKYDKAIADFDMAIEIAPNLSEAITYRNKALEQKKKATTGR